MEDTFRFEIGMGLYATIATTWVEIPMELHDRVAASVGTGTMERLEFGYSFQDIVARKFPELDAVIHKAIDDWASEHVVENHPLEGLHRYGLESSWFI